MPGEYEPKDSRNVTGTASTSDGRWTNDQGQPRDAAGQPQQQGAAGRQPGGMDERGGQQSQFQDERGQMGGGGQMGEARFADQLREHMEVCGPDGEAIGTIDSVERDQIKLTRSDSADGMHHWIDCADIAGIENGQVRLARAPDWSRQG